MVWNRWYRQLARGLCTFVCLRLFMLVLECVHIPVSLHPDPFFHFVFLPLRSWTGCLGAGQQLRGTNNKFKECLKRRVGRTQILAGNKASGPKAALIHRCTFSIFSSQQKLSSIRAWVNTADWLFDSWALLLFWQRDHWRYLSLLCAEQEENGGLSKDCCHSLSGCVSQTASH